MTGAVTLVGIGKGRVPSTADAEIGEPGVRGPSRCDTTWTARSGAVAGRRLDIDGLVKTHAKHGNLYSLHSVGPVVDDPESAAQYELAIA
jgi:hypothetical protein